MYTENAHDLNRKYSESFIRYKGVLAFAKEFKNLDAGLCQMFYHTADSKSILGGEVRDGDIENIIFDAKFFNRTTKGIPGTLYTRFPRRQYRRSTCADNSVLNCPIMNLYNMYGKQIGKMWSSGLTFADIEALENPVYPSYHDAIKTIGSTQCIAISPDFAVTLSNQDEDKYLLASRFGFIGKCDEKEMVVHHSPAYQEVQDFLARSHIANVELRRAS